MRNSYDILVGKPERESPLGRSRRRWENNIRLGLGAIGWGDGNWMCLTQDIDQWRAVLNTVMNLWVL
jgi:hypothetical protein